MITPKITLRAPRPGDFGWIVQRHGLLYACLLYTSDAADE